MSLFGRFISRASLKQKLTTITMLISLIVLLLASGSFILSKTTSYRQDTINKLTSITGILGTNIEEAVLLKRKHVISQMLNSLGNEPEVSAAYVFSIDGKLLGQFLNSGANGSTEEILSLDPKTIQEVIASKQGSHIFRHRNLLFYAPIIKQERLVGVIALQANLTNLYQFIYQFIASTVAVFLLLSLIAYLLISRLQTIITRPISDLAETIEKVSKKNDFSLRAASRSEDEIGDLIDGFNKMLEQLQARDSLLGEYRHNLEGLVLQRTRELQQSNTDLQQAIRELKTAKKTAEEANLAKSQFLAKMSHEIRTPMIGIMGMTEQLTEAPLPEEEKRLAWTVHKSGETLLSILDDVLDFSKIEAGRLDLEEIPFSMPELCDEVIAIFSKQAEEKGLVLSCHIDEDCRGNFIGDPIRIKQILLNLIGNAVKFTPDGEVLLTASYAGHDQDRTIWLAVTDTGIGIPAGAQEQIFDSFSQADNSMTRKFGGSGLGLTIVRQLTHLMGGSCGLQSTPGKGSTFWIVLDLPIAESISPAPVDITSKPAAACTSGIGRQPRILLVEDNLTTQQLLRLILTKNNCKLDISQNGELAIEAVESNDYDLIFMDCEMPGMDGYETTRELRQRNCEIPIIALTAHVRKEDITRCLEAGMDDYLSKPFRQQQLLEAINKWLTAESISVNESQG